MELSDSAVIIRGFGKCTNDDIKMAAVDIDYLQSLPSILSKKSKVSLSISGVLIDNDSYPSVSF